PESVIESMESAEVPAETDYYKLDIEERELLKVLIKFGQVKIITDAEDEASNLHELEITLSEFILMELWRDDIVFENETHKAVLDEFVHELSNYKIPDVEHFKNHQNAVISQFTINQVINNYVLSPGWFNKFGILVQDEIHNVKRSSEKILFSLKSRILQKYKQNVLDRMRLSPESEHTDLQLEMMKLDALLKRVGALLGRVVIR
ncbi:MAG TPA: hypothetical protein PKK99_13925, partial [Bacteroidia bacterium]|nr:hypothetical protein [Bacteroidia bacterium]